MTESRAESPCSWEGEGDERAREDEKPFRSHLGDTHWEEERKTCTKNNRNTGGNGLLGNQAVNKQKPKARKQFQ